MLNYEVDARILTPFVPPGIELDAWQGKTLASIVAFEFAEVRILNRSIPLHRDFEEMNLRFYVRRRTADGWRRGVVFVRELVPLPTVALLARLLYGRTLQGTAHGPAFPASSHAARISGHKQRESVQPPFAIPGIMTRPGTAWKQQPTPRKTPGTPNRVAKRSSLPTTPTDMVPAAARPSNTSSNTLRGATGTR